MARNLVYTTLPHRRLDAPTWKREAGRFALRLSRAAIAERDATRLCQVSIPQGRPYGPKARLMLLYACTWALQQKDPHLPLGETLSEFLRLVGLAPLAASGGGPRSDGVLLKDQLMRFWCTDVLFTETRPGMHMLRVLLSKEMRCQWIDPRAPEAEAAEGSYMVLTDEFIAHVNTPGVCVPLDLRAVTALSHSSLAMDLYGLLANRSFVAAQRGEDQLLAWESLAAQLGQDYADPSNFRRHAIDALPAIAEVYPDLDFRIQRGGRSRRSGLVVTSLSRPAIAAAFDQPPRLLDGAI